MSFMCGSWPAIKSLVSIFKLEYKLYQFSCFVQPDMYGNKCNKNIIGRLNSKSLKPGTIKS